MTTDTIGIGIIILIAVLDVFLIVTKTGSFTSRIRNHGRNLTLLPYAWGALGGHFWGPSREPYMNDWPRSIAILVTIGLALSLVHYITRRKIDLPVWVPLLYLLVGIPAGMLFFPVN